MNRLMRPGRATQLLLVGSGSGSREKMSTWVIEGQGPGTEVKAAGPLHSH